MGVLDLGWNPSGTYVQDGVAWGSWSRGPVVLWLGAMEELRAGCGDCR